ncbi:MAG: DASS family sodium-coupled anion symporter [Deltaproteobacteria bacterium]|nr:DASS family sodium-coupled anion symporter [Deltaproteobacteria bacterium]
MNSKSVGLFLGPILFILILCLPFPTLSPAAHRLSAVLLWVVVYWITEAIPLPSTALLGAVLAILLGVEKSAKVLAPFANPVIFLFIGSFLLAKAMEAHHLDKRISLWLLSKLGHSQARAFLGVIFLSFTLSMWMSNTAATVILLPITLGLIHTMEKEHKVGAKTKSKVLLLIAYAASIGGIATPVGTPPNLIGLGLIRDLVGARFSFFQWMTLGVPISLVTLLLLLLITKPWRGDAFKGASPKIEGGLGSSLESQRKELGALTAGERNTMVAFFAAVLLWTLPGFLAIVMGNDHPLVIRYNDLLPESVVALMAALLLFILPTSLKEMKFTLSWEQATTIDWGTILLFGGGMSLGTLMFATGLAEHLGQTLIAWTHVNSLWPMTFFSIVIAVFLSETTSNTAAANMVVPVMIAMAQAAQINPIPPALGATLGASFGFMLPISTPPNAIAYSTGLIPIRLMVRYGIVLDLVGIVVIFTGLRLLWPMIGG